MVLLCVLQVAGAAGPFITVQSPGHHGISVSSPEEAAVSLAYWVFQIVLALFPCFLLLTSLGSITYNDGTYKCRVHNPGLLFLLFSVSVFHLS